MPSWSTPVYSPDRSLVWPNSFYYVRTDAGGANLPGTVTTALTNTAAYHAGLPLGSKFRIETFNTDAWNFSATDCFNPPVTANYFPETWPGGTPTKTTWSSVNQYLSNGTQHLYFANLRQENAYKNCLSGAYQPQGASGDRHSVLWAESVAYGRELVESIGYNGTGPYCNAITTFDLTTYTMPNADGGGPAGVVAARVPVAPFFFTNADLQAAIAGTGDLGHMLGWVAANYRNQWEWPARFTDGTLTGDYLKAGSVIRLRADYPVASLPTDELKVIARTMQRYGVMLFDKNSTKALLAVPSDSAWPNGAADIGDLWNAENVDLLDFEQVDISSLMVATNSIEVNGSPGPTGPTATFTRTPSSGTAPLTVAFTDTSTPGSGTITGWAWTFGDSGTSTSQNPSHTYSSAGTYTVNLTVTDSNGLTDTAPPLTVTVSAAPIVGPTAAFTTTATSGPAPLVVAFTNASTDGDAPIVSYLWDFGDGNTDTGPAPGHTYLTNGTYAATLTVTDSNGLSDTSDPVYFYVTEACTARWELPDNSLPAIPLNGTTSFNLAFAGLTAGDLMFVVCRTLHTTTVTITPPSGWNELGTQQTGTDTGGNAHSFQVFWKEFDGVTLTEGPWSGGAGYSYGWFHSLTKTGSGTPVIDAVVEGGPTAAAQSFQAPDYATSGATSVLYFPTGLPPNSTGYDTGILLNAHGFTNVQTGALQSNMQWGFYEKKVGTAQTVQVPNVKSNPAYYAPLPWLYKAASLTFCPAPPVASFTATPISGFAPLTVTFTDTSTAPDYPLASWYWDFGDGNTSTLQNPTHTYATPGLYAVTLQVTDTIGQQDTSPQQFITVQPPISCNIVSGGWNPPGSCTLNVGANVTADPGLGYTAYVNWGDSPTAQTIGHYTGSTTLNLTHDYSATPLLGPTTIAITFLIDGETTPIDGCLVPLSVICGIDSPAPCAIANLKSGPAEGGGCGATLCLMNIPTGNPTNVFDVDWGDGTTETFSFPAGDTEEIVCVDHTYATYGNYEITVSSLFFGAPVSCTEVWSICEPPVAPPCPAPITWAEPALFGFTGNPLTFFGGQVRCDYENSYQCGGSNTNTQTAYLQGTITVAAPTTLSLLFDGQAELENYGFDWAYVNIERPGDPGNVLVAGEISRGGGLGCAQDTTVTWNTGPDTIAYAYQRYEIQIPAGTSTITLVFSTGDPNWHQGSWNSVTFTTECTVEPLIPDTNCLPGAELGFGEDLRVLLVNRGAQFMLAELKPTSGYFTRQLNKTSELEFVGVVTGIGGDECCDDYLDVYPWITEIYVFRDGRDAWSGPVTEVEFEYGSVRIRANDLTAWWDRRVLPDLNYVGQDIATIFNSVHLAAMAPDPVPYFGVAATATDIFADRAYSGGDYKYASDALDELTKTGVDWTCYGRTVIAGGTEVPAEPYFVMLDDFWSKPPTVIARGNEQATKVVVKGEGVAGVATASTDYLNSYGLLVRVFDENTIKDAASAQASARTRLELLQDQNYLETPSGAGLTPTAPITLPELIPGIRVRVTTTATCRPLTADFRLTGVKVDFNGLVSIDLQPLGTNYESPRPKYAKTVAIGDSLTAWSEEAALAAGQGEPFSTLPSDRWQDLLVADGLTGYCLNAAKPGLNTRLALSSPIQPPQSCDLLIIYLGANDMVHQDRTFPPGPFVPDPASWVLPAEYKTNLQALLAAYPHDQAMLIFPWKWNANFVDSAWDTDLAAASRMAPYRAVAAAVAAEAGAGFLDLSQYYDAPTRTLDPLPSYLCDGLIHANKNAHREIATRIEGILSVLP